MKRLIAIGFFGLCVTSFTAILFNSPAYAADAHNYNAGNIIDDNVFTNSSAMSVSAIQTFLNSKVTCDNWGTKPSELGGGTRAQWLSAHGISTPITCLRDYYENPSNAQNNYGKAIPSGAISAAQIIYNYSQQFHINPQVILVTLQKENGLVTDEWPTPKQYSEAMGFGCPDNVAPGAPACDPDYGSFSAQIYQAARHFRGFIDNNAGWFVPFTTGSNYIAWSPISSCGGSNVNIQNRATVALYSYTPYQPNRAAEDAQYGMGDGCSSYGNRNFYMYFTDWFGSVRDSLQTSGLQITKDGAGQTFTDNPVELSFTVKNNTYSDYSFKYLGVAVRGPSGQNMDPGWLSNITIHPGQTYTYKKTITPTEEGQYTIYISSYAQQDSDWRECYLDNSQSTCKNPHIIQKPIVITTTPNFSGKISGQPISELRQNQRFVGTYTLKNSSTQYSVKPGSVMLAGRAANGAAVDLPRKDAGTLTPGQQYIYSAENISKNPPATYTFYTSTTKNGWSWEERAFTPSSASVSQAKQVDLKSGVVLSQGVTTTPTAIVGASHPIAFKVRNYGDTPVDIGHVGVTVRGPHGENKDPKWEMVSDLAGEYTYSASFIPTVEGQWTVGYTSASSDFTFWNDKFPSNDATETKRSAVITASDPTVLSQGPMLSDAKTYENKEATVTFKIKTTSDSAVDLGRVGVTVRGPHGENKDPKWERVDDLSTNNIGTPSGVYTYQAHFTPTSPGKWTISYMDTTENYTIWDTSKPKSENDSVKRSITVDVLPQATVTTGIAVTGTTMGSQTATFTVANHGSTPVDLGLIGLAVRDPQGGNGDKKWESFTIPANSTKQHSVVLPFDKLGTWNLQITSYKDGHWYPGIPIGDDGSVVTQMPVVIH